MASEGNDVSNDIRILDFGPDSLRFAVGALGWMWMRAIRRYDTLQADVDKLKRQVALLERANELIGRKDRDRVSRDLPGAG
jgi:hypothetical protein